MAVLVRFDDRGGWDETLVCEVRVQGGLRALGVLQGRWPAQERAAPAAYDARYRLLAQLPQADASAWYVAEGTVLFHLASAQGWLGLLCEAGEWLVLPAQLQYAFDPGEPPAEVVRVPETQAGEHESACFQAALPRHREFVHRLLALSGDVVTTNRPPHSLPQGRSA
jgi:1,2-dihydroxy-3-keto-5-methylthiopentene dioxygenase